ncbi:hypothetical protein [Pseudonocardia sp.]|jgi:hypothetical protein|uniref:hypothetical protein n=1 Tax=Pseudonocardia sp. TaxID=60912 RepID=UPI0031FD54B7
MCGACGGAPPDPAGPRVAGPHRRAAVARIFTAASHGLAVRTVPGGWTAATRSGRTTVCRTLDGLVAAVLPHVATDSTAALQALVASVAGPREESLDAARAAVHALEQALAAQPRANGGRTGSAAPFDGRTSGSRTATPSSR